MAASVLSMTPQKAPRSDSLKLVCIGRGLTVRGRVEIEIHHDARRCGEAVGFWSMSRMGVVSKLVQSYYPRRPFSYLRTEGSNESASQFITMNLKGKSVE